MSDTEQVPGCLEQTTAGGERPSGNTATSCSDLDHASEPLTGSTAGKDEADYNFSKKRNVKPDDNSLGKKCHGMQCFVFLLI